MKWGYTLIEVLVVVLIIGVLSAVAAPYYFNAVENARLTELRVLWGRQKDYVAGRELSASDLSKINEHLQKAHLKHFTGQIICREGAPAGVPCYEAIFIRNTNAGAQYQITTVNNFRNLACIPQNTLGTRFCKFRMKPNGEITINGQEAYLIH